MRERDVHPDFHAQRVVDRVHLGLDIGPSLCARGRDIRHPDDDDRKQHDGHREDQDRADDLGHTRLVFAEDGSHRVASRWAQGNRLAPDPTIYKLFVVVTTTAQPDSQIWRDSEARTCYLWP